MNEPPNVIQRGIVLLVLCPTNSRTIWGITNPIQEIVPQKQTEIAVNKVAKPTIKYRYLLYGRPLVWAAVLPRATR